MELKTQVTQLEANIRRLQAQLLLVRQEIHKRDGLRQYKKIVNAVQWKESDILPFRYTRFPDSLSATSDATGLVLRLGDYAVWDGTTWARMSKETFERDYHAV